MNKLLAAMQKLTNEKKWVQANKYHRDNVGNWKAIKILMESSRDYRNIRDRYKNHHDAEMQKNADRALTQQEERALRKYVYLSPGGSIKFKSGFKSTATQLKIPAMSAKKRFVLCVCVLFWCIPRSVIKLTYCQTHLLSLGCFLSWASVILVGVLLSAVL